MKWKVEAPSLENVEIKYLTLSKFPNMFSSNKYLLNLTQISKLVQASQNYVFGDIIICWKNATQF